MSRWEIRGLHLAALLLALTGAALAVAKYLLAPAVDDPFSAAGASWQPFALAGHVIAAPVLVFLVGCVFRRHVLAKLRDPRDPGRATGLAVLWLFAALTASGYGLQVATHEGLRRALALGHLGAGCLFALGYSLHARLRPPVAADPALATTASRRWRRSNRTLTGIAPSPDNPDRPSSRPAPPAARGRARPRADADDTAGGRRTSPHVDRDDRRTGGW